MRILTLMFIAIFGLTAAVSAREPEKVTVRVGQSRSVDRGKLNIKFLAVAEDSRCPINAKCVWAGNARITLTVSKGRSAAQTIELNTGVKPISLKVFGYEIILEDLTPRPAVEVKGRSVKKQATLTVTKIG